MSKRGIYSIGSLLLVISAIACNISNDEQKIVDIDPVFTLDMLEDLQNNKNLLFVVNSVEWQDCENFTINSAINRSPSMLEVVLNEIVPPSDCIQGFGPATTTLTAGPLTSNRTYDIKFSLQNTVTNDGSFHNAPNYYSLALSSTNGFGSTVNELYKIPNKLIWGYIAYNEEDLVGDLPDTILDEVKSLSNEVTLTEGYYGHFRVNDNNNLQLKRTLDFQNINTFYRLFSGNTLELKALLDDYRNGPNGDLIELKIWTDSGEVL